MSWPRILFSPGIKAHQPVLGGSGRLTDRTIMQMILFNQVLQGGHDPDDLEGPVLLGLPRAVAAELPQAPHKAHSFRPTSSTSTSFCTMGANPTFSALMVR